MIMKSKILLLLIIVSTSTFAQELVVLNKGVLNGKFSGNLGAKGGTSISATASEDGYTISLTGDESWAGIYITNKSVNEKIDLSTYKYLVMSLRSEEDVVVEKIGYGLDGEKSELIRKVELNKNWKTFVLALPEGMSEQKGLFSFITVGKAKVDVSEIRYTTTLPEDNGATTFLIPAEAERLEGVNYVFNEGFETGAPSGYSGEKNGASMLVDDKCMESPYKGKYCLKIKVDDKETWRALFLQVLGNWTALLAPDSKLPDLSEYKKLVFYARSTDKDYLIPEIGFGGETNRFSQEPRNIVFIDLDEKWTRYEIDLRGLEKESVNDVMMLVLNEGTLFLDEIRFEK